MNPKMIWSNLAVSDLELTKKFYTALGFKSNNTRASTELTSFMVGENDFVINFFLKDVLKNNLKIEIANPNLATEVVFTLSAENKSQVDNWEKVVEKAGGKIISSPEEFGEGYYGFLFADPDGHKFNVFFMEGL